MDTDNKAKIPAFDTDMKHTATNIVGEHGLDTPMNLSIEGGHEKAITEAIVMDESIHDNLLSISDMAKLHGLTRPTLLYYDSIGLFSPVFTASNGYRYYSRVQIPLLREICFLKALGISLKEIQGHLNNRTPEAELELLAEQELKIQREMQELGRKRLALQQRLYMYKEAVNAVARPQGEPFLRHYKERTIIFKTFLENDSGDVDRQNIHLTSMELWRDLYNHEFLPAYSYGFLIKEEALKTDNMLKDGGCYIRVPVGNFEFESTVLNLPEGDYICCYKRGRPTDLTVLKQLLAWIAEKGYTVCGDVVDSCFLDMTFDEVLHDEIFTILQIPVVKK